jgi:hypothetical protein
MAICCLTTAAAHGVYAGDSCDINTVYTSTQALFSIENSNSVTH